MNYENGISNRKCRLGNRNYKKEPNKNSGVEKYNNRLKNLLEGFTKQFSVNFKILKYFSEHSGMNQ